MSSPDGKQSTDPTCGHCGGVMSPDEVEYWGDDDFCTACIMPETVEDARSIYRIVQEIARA